MESGDSDAIGLTESAPCPHASESSLEAQAMTGEMVRIGRKPTNCIGWHGILVSFDSFRSCSASFERHFKAWHVRIGGRTHATPEAGEGSAVMTKMSRESWRKRVGREE